MSRYRPPRPKSSPYITPAGRDTLQEELNYLWKTKRPEVTRKVAEAAAQGDRSENAEYIYGKKQLREIDGRIRYLSKRLDEVEVIYAQPKDKERVLFGVWVTLEDEAGELKEYRIVGADEIDANAGYISIDAPMARALIGKGLDDEVDIAQRGDSRIYDPNARETVVRYLIANIRYQA